MRRRSCSDSSSRPAPATPGGPPRWPRRSATTPTPCCSTAASRTTWCGLCCTPAPAALLPLAWHHAWQPEGRPEALRLFEESITIAEHFDHRIAAGWMQVARFHEFTGDRASAIAAFTRALDLYADVPDLRIEPLAALYAAHRDAGDQAAASGSEPRPYACSNQPATPTGPA